MLLVLLVLAVVFFVCSFSGVGVPTNGDEEGGEQPEATRESRRLRKGSQRTTGDSEGEGQLRARGIWQWRL
jgi:hypothetical protein